MGDKKRFVPVRGPEARISAAALGFNDGYLYFATDTGRIYLDYVDDDGVQIARAMVGNSSGGAGGNSGIYYASKTLTADEKLETSIIFPIDSIEGDDYPQKDDIIINIPEGSFYRVTAPSPLTSSVTALRLTIAGGGGSASTLAEDIDLQILRMDTINFINNQPANVKFIATSAKNAKGKEIDSQLTITYTLAYTEDDNNYTTYKTDKFLVNSGEETTFNFGPYAKLSSKSKLTLKATQSSVEGSIIRSIDFTTSDLQLTLANTFSNLVPFAPNEVKLQCNVTGNMDKIVEYYFDDLDNPFYVEELTAESTEQREVNVSVEGKNKVSLTHGSHKIAIRLFQSINGNKGLEVDPLIFEIAINNAPVDTKPIIWLGDYKTSYYNYDIIQIPFRVVDPNAEGSGTVVHFKKNNRELDNSPLTITDNSQFSYFEIADAELDVLNRYQITCGKENNETVREIEFTVQVDPARSDFGIQKTNFLTYMLNTIGSGRSNNESDVKRQTLIYTNPQTGEVIKAKFDNFNWFNNGWIRDKTTDNKTCLRISNGAKLEIPIGQMKFGVTSGSSSDLAHTIELQFKIRNVQDYSQLIHNITRYKKDGPNTEEHSDNYDLFSKFYDSTTHEYKTSYTNYDSFLTWYLRENNIPFTDPKTKELRSLTYDDLEFDYIQKQINLNNVCCGYYTGDTSSVTGMCFGPQDMFFSNGSNTVSATYVEDQLISVSIVYQHGDTDAQKLIMIYINGILNSVIKNTESDGFTIESDKIVFNSKSCDIDLYKLRIYNTTLNVNDIVMNYAADFENIDIYDQNKLAKPNGAINEYYFDYRSMMEYNRNHPSDPLMPYIIFDTTSGPLGIDQQKLSYSKSVKLDIGVEFVNTPLELAYTSGELEELAKADGLWKNGDSPEKKAAAVKTYYKHHCPSWRSGFTADPEEIGHGVEMAVQGTSSEFYPRRNYKLKTKTKYDDGETSRIHIFLNRGPFANDFEADRVGVFEDPYIISNEAYNQSLDYYSDPEGKNKVIFDSNNPYKYNTYYIKNPNYVEFGKEKTRQDYWYMNNYTTGTTKFTMKIDYMESSGSYNMGFANLVKNGYSKHPLDDYNRVGAFQVEDPENTVVSRATKFKEGTKYYYMTHKGALKPADGSDEPMILSSAEDFAKTPLELWMELGQSKLKVLVSEESAAAYNAAHGTNITATMDNAIAESGKTQTELEPYVDSWFEMVPGYKDFTIKDTDDYRTSVGGFRVLAFHKKFLQDGTIYYQYIGMYNMLLDKGSDEVYGFKPDKTCGDKTISQKFVKNKKISKVAECWECENNNRTYCSFRDPDKRKDLTFDAFQIVNGQKIRKLNSVRSAPLVADSFEYRYHDDADTLDYIMDPIKESDKMPDESFRFNVDDPTENQDTRAEFLLDKYKNWEKACQWVWSTCTDYVISQGNYEKTVVGDTLWEPDTFYIMDQNNYIKDTGDSWNPNLTYYKRGDFDSLINDYVYSDAHAVDADHIFNENKVKFFINLNEHDQTKTPDYASCVNDPEFNDSAIYYELVNYTDEQMAVKEANNEVDRLVRQCTIDDVFDVTAEYYTYDGTQLNGRATTKVNISADEFNANKTNYYIGITVDKYIGRTYKYDTKEYRADKFINELTEHFDLEYVATYFVMTEVFECYDSRGKNAMFASWGPQKAGGDYIWYPIFYDIDTQLGVNNTGIPSFDYNVDATEDGNYSTSDSVLWNNFYKYFKSSAIIAKYKHLRGVTVGNWPALKHAPISTVDRIEGWYNSDPKICNQIVMRGKRPIVAKNLDEYYKYITITNGSNQQALDNGLIGHLDSNTSGDQVVDDGQYFYMLQGDRQLSRRQFLTNRLEYIDSWLNQGDYQRGGGNRIRGRVSANNSDTSDKWVENPNDPNTSYFIGEEGGKKRHLFDAEYWVTLTPTHSSYVTLGDDNEAYPSQKYDGIHPLKFEISAIKNGVRTSAGYPEQLLYIYGMNNMSDLGDMSKLYWREFSITGKATKLTSLKFGYDGVMPDPEDSTKNIRYQNNGLNNFSIGAEKTPTTPGLPLLKYMNMSNVNLSQSASTTVLDLTSCEKLENFRATGSNFTEFKFAEGVALNTLYLPTSLVSLKLTEARLLKNLITNYEIPTLNNEGELVAQPGLYFEGMFENNTTNISTLNILGSGLGYDSYKLLKKYYDIRKSQGQPSNIQMTNVQWSPYIRVTEDEEYDPLTYDYFEDNGHYGLSNYTYHIDTWSIKVINKEIYKKIKIDQLSEAESNKITNDINQITNVDMLRVFADEDSAAFRTEEGKNVPNITGIIYVNNAQSQKVQTGEKYDSFYKYYTNIELTNQYIYSEDTWEDAIINNLYKTISENGIRNQLQIKFPYLTFFFAHVDEAYTAKFLLMNEDEGENGIYTLIGSQTIESGWFANPIDLYLAGDIEKLKPNHDFKGWATTNSLNATLLVNVDKSINNWSNQSLNTNQHTYNFYAICPIHSWDVKFYDNGVLFDTVKVPHENTCNGPSITPYRDDSELELTQTYLLAGYARTENAKTPIDLSSFQIIGDTNFYTVWNTDPISVYDNVHPEYFKVVGVPNVYGAVIQLDKKVTGKLTIPYNITYNGTEYPVTTFKSNATARNSDPLLENITHIFFKKNTNGSTTVSSIGDYCFSQCTNLQYFEFDAPGLNSIGGYAFYGAQNLKLSSLVTGTFTFVGNYSFTNAFGHFDNQLILFDGNIDANGYSLSTFKNGANENLSNITLQFGSNEMPFTNSVITEYSSTQALPNSNNQQGPLYGSIYYTDILSSSHLVVKKIVIYVMSNSFWTTYDNVKSQYNDDRNYALLSSLCTKNQADKIINELLPTAGISLQDFIQVIVAGS